LLGAGFRKAASQDRIFEESWRGSDGSVEQGKPYHGERQNGIQFG
jgi:hypothetical protein